MSQRENKHSGKNSRDSRQGRSRSVPWTPEGAPSKLSLGGVFGFGETRTLHPKQNFPAQAELRRGTLQCPGTIIFCIDSTSIDI